MPLDPYSKLAMGVVMPLLFLAELGATMLLALIAHKLMRRRDPATGTLKPFPTNVFSRTFISLLLFSYSQVSV